MIRCLIRSDQRRALEQKLEKPLTDYNSRGVVN
jgi:hypothetical protein